MLISLEKDMEAQGKENMEGKKRKHWEGSEGTSGGKEPDTEGKGGEKDMEEKGFGKLGEIYELWLWWGVEGKGWRKVEI